MRRLLADVDLKREEQPELTVGHCGLDLDIICAIVEAHVEGVAAPAVHPAEPLTITGAARLRLAVAALHYLLEPDDVVPDRQPHGYDDDAVVLGWASRVTRAELPV